MRYRFLGQTPIQVSTVGFGAWAISGDFTWGAQDERDAEAAIRTALEEGVTFFDTAPAYGEGRSETLLGRVLAPVRHRVVIATKVPPTSLEPKALRASCEESLRRLNTEYVDLLQIHWPNPKADMEAAFETLLSLQSAGRIRAFGVSNFGCRDLAPILKHPEWVPATNQLAYSLLFRAIEYEIQPFCVKQKISILCYSPLVHGLLTGKFTSADEVPVERARTRHFSKNRPHTRHGEAGAEAETFAAIAAIREVARELEEPMANIALAWLLAQEGVASVLVGMRNAIQARRNARAGQLALPPAIIRKLSDMTQPLKKKLGPNPDMWETPPRIH